MMREGGFLLLFIITWTMVFTYSKIIVTYLSTQYSIAIHTKVKESIILGYRTQLSIYLQQLQFPSHVSYTKKVGTHLAAIPLLISLFCRFLEPVYINDTMSLYILSILFWTFAIKGIWPEFFEAVLETSIIIFERATFCPFLLSGSHICPHIVFHVLSSKYSSTRQV